MFKYLRRLPKDDINYILDNEDFKYLVNEYGKGVESITCEDIDYISVMRHGLFRESAVIIYTKHSDLIQLKRNIPFVCSLEGVSSTTYKDLKEYTPNKVKGFKRFYIRSYSIEVFNEQNNCNELHDIKDLLYKLGWIKLDTKYGKYYVTNKYKELKPIKGGERFPKDLLYPMIRLSDYVFSDDYYLDNFKLIHKFPAHLVS